MSRFDHQIIIRDPEAFHRTVETMVRVDCLPNFGQSLVRLLDLFSCYLDQDTLPDRKRTAHLWSALYQQPDFFWSIQEEPTVKSEDSDQPPAKALLNGSLHYDTQQKTWGIHT